MHIHTLEDPPPGERARVRAGRLHCHCEYVWEVEACKRTPDPQVGVRCKGPMMAMRPSGSRWASKCPRVWLGTLEAVAARSSLQETCCTRCATESTKVELGRARSILVGAARAVQTMTRAGASEPIVVAGSVCGSAGGNLSQLAQG